MLRNYTAILCVALAGAACVDPKCPSGYFQKGDTCYRCRPVDGRDGGACVIGDAAVSAPDDAGAGDDSEMDAGSPGEAGTPDEAAGGTTDASTGGASGEAGRDGDTEAATGCPANHRDTGNGCERIDNCAPNPCQNDGACTDGDDTFSCVCASGFVGPTCENESCGPLTIRNRADLQKYEKCGEVVGDLVIEANFGEVNAADLPNLEVVRGRLKISPLLGALEPVVQTARSVTLQALTTAQGGIEVLSSPEGPHELRFPRLQTIGSEAQPAVFNMLGSVRNLELPELRTVYGHVMWMTRLCIVDVRKVQRVTGDLTLPYAPQLLYSSIASLVAATRGMKQVDHIGCCFLTDRTDCTGFGPGPDDCAASNCSP